MNDPVADTVRSILDGHIVLSRKLASEGHYPAIDVLQSISRVMIDVVPEAHLQNANKIKEILSVYNDAEDLLNIGAYVRGSNPRIDHAVQMIDRIKAFQKQGIFEKSTLEETQNLLEQLTSEGAQA